MLAFKITNLKEFTNQLFIGDTFHPFWFIEGDFTTFNRFSIDGALQKDFFDTDELADLDRPFSLWKEIQPFCCSVIRGKHTPLNFKIVLQYPVSAMNKVFSSNLASASPIGACYLNIQFKNGTLLCTTGVSYKTFIPDKQAEFLWDDLIKRYFQKHNIEVESL
ncbi:MAG: DUF5721 family protein [Eubacteriales bacterium]|nr:DUF5721 family protein [Eubacteriales bacterium]